MEHHKHKTYKDKEELLGRSQKANYYRGTTKIWQQNPQQSAFKNGIIQSVNWEEITVYLELYGQKAII